jgi:hypothetical protein
MARFVNIQTNFTSGEIDPLIRSRVDLESYKNGLEVAKNVICQPQGGVTRRPGTRFITELGGSPANGVRLVHFEFSVDDSYMLAFTNNRMYVFKDKALVTNINGSGNDYLTTTIASAQLGTMCYTQSADTLIVVHEDIVPKKIVRGASDSTWTISDITFDSVPQYAFSLSTHNPVGTLTAGDVTGKVTLEASQAQVNGTAQTGSTSTTIKLATGASATDDAYNGMYVTITSGTGNGQERLITDYVGSTRVATVDTAWTTTPDNTSVYALRVFTPNVVGQYINASPQGRARIVKYVDARNVNVVTEFPFFDTTAIASGDWEIETGYEDVWSASRGYPRSVTFHQGRLFFGGSKSRPSTIWGSKVALFFDFEPVEGLDDDAVEATLDTNTFNAIVDLISGRDLQVFTTGGEFYVPQEGLTPITPTDFFLSSTSRNGTKEGIRVKQLESGVLFIQRQGKQLSEIAYSDTQLTYITSKISLLSGHLLKNPTRMDIRRAVATDENDLLLIVNGDDGTMAVYSLLRAQNVIAPSEFVTNGSYIDVGVDITDIYIVVKRNDNGTDKYYIEVFDDEVLTDSAVTGTTASLDASHIDGKTVHVISDGLVEEDQTADSAVTFTTQPTTSGEVGMHFDVEVKTMPVDLRIQTGTRIGFKKRIVEVNALIYKTQNLVINGNLVPIRTLGAGLLDTAVPEFTGTKVLHGILGYSNEGQITVTQSAPMKFTLLGLEYKLATHQGT